MSFTSRSFQVVDGPAGSRQVVLRLLLSAADARVLGTALTRQRVRDFLAPGMEAADEVLTLRRLVTLIDQVDEVADAAPGAPVQFTEDQVGTLAEATARYLGERDADEGYVPQGERERLERLRGLQGQLFDAVADFAGAREEAAAGGLTSDR